MPVTVFRRPGSKIWSYYGRAGDPPRRFRGSTGATDRAIAERIAAKRELEQWKSSLDGPEAILTFAKAALLYKAAGKPSKYLKKIAIYWKDTLIKDITPGAIRQSALTLYPNHSGATLNRQGITPTQSIINYCAELELCPPIRVRRFKFEKKIKKPVLLEWLDTFCAHADLQMSALATLMFATACRISEARRLEWSDIDFKERTILVRKTKNKRERLPSMPYRLLVLLAKLPRDRKPFGEPETNLRRHWDVEVLKTATIVPGFERLTFHSCRHGFATKLLRDGIDPKTVAELGGWDDIGTLMKTYVHAMPSARIADRIFDTDLTRDGPIDKQKQEVSGK